MRKIVSAIAFVCGLFIQAAAAQSPPPVPALPDNERRTTYSITSSTCSCAINMALYGDSTDYQNWVEVWLNGVRVNYNDPSFGWTITSPTGPLATIPRPITDAVLTFNNGQTGTIQIVGARRPRRITQFSENRGVAARDLNQALTDIIAQNRETWDKINDVTGRAVLTRPGETLNLLPILANRLNQGACFDSGGNLTSCVSVPSSTFTAGNGIAFTGVNPTTITNNIQAGTGIAITGTNPLTVTNNTQAGPGISFSGTNPTIISGASSALGFANVSGSSQTTTGSMSASSATLTLTAAQDFKNGQGIRVNHAGAANGLGAPSGLTVTPTGTGGSTTYTYTIAPCNGSGGYGPAIANVSTSTGNATLSITNYNALSWTAASGAVCYGVFGRNSGSLTLLALTAGTFFWDTGTNFYAPAAPDWFVSTPPAIGAANWLVTTISSGGGTTTLTLAAAATTTESLSNVVHDDTTALQNAINTMSSSGIPLYFDPGTYRISSVLNVTSGSPNIYGSSMFGGSQIFMSSPTQNGISITNGAQFPQVHDISMSGNGTWAVGGTFLTSTAIAGTFYRIDMQYCANGINTNSISNTLTRNILGCSQTNLNMTSPNDTHVYGNDFNPVEIPGSSAGGGGVLGIGVVLAGDPGGMRFDSNKCNAGGFGYTVCFSVVASISDGDLFIQGNSMEGWNTYGVLINYSGSITFGNIIITGNEIAGTGRAIDFPGTVNGSFKYITIDDNVLFATITGIAANGIFGIEMGGNWITGGSGSAAVILSSGVSGCIFNGNGYFWSGSVVSDSSSGACVYNSRTTTQPSNP